MWWALQQAQQYRELAEVGSGGVVVFRGPQGSFPRTVAPRCEDILAVIRTPPYRNAELNDHPR
jgi:hypothetical protein